MALLSIVLLCSLSSEVGPNDALSVQSYSLILTHLTLYNIDHVVELSKLRYAKFTVKALLKYWYIT